MSTKQFPKFAKDQPKKGDIVLHCGHLDTEQAHFFKAKKPMGFTRTDGTHGWATWLVQCAACWNPTGDPIIRGDGTWTDDEPFVEEELKN